MFTSATGGHLILTGLVRILNHRGVLLSVGTFKEGFLMLEIVVQLLMQLLYKCKNFGDLSAARSLKKAIFKAASGSAIEIKPISVL
mgnify:CR=1 FL=1